jgi:hypothetical protein
MSTYELFRREAAAIVADSLTALGREAEASALRVRYDLGPDD